MRRSWTWAILILIAVIGFYLGRWTGGGDFARLTDGATDIPLFPAPPKPEPEAEPVQGDGSIVLEMPVEDAVISGSELEVSGRAKTDGGPLRIAIKDGAGNEIAAQQAEISSPDGEFGRFSAKFAFASQPVGEATIEVGRAAAVDSAKVTRFVTFGDEAATDGASGDVVIRAYFHSAESASGTDCTAVVPVDRTVPLKSAAYRAALEALLEGLTPTEVGLGFTTAIPAGVSIKSVAIDAKGTVTADFDAKLDRGVAGSCRVGAIRAQIESTLRQFPEVRAVTISVEGEIDEALQP